MTDPPAHPDVPSAPPARTAGPRARCPRCGAPLGRLAAASAPDAPAELYCGCCGLVLPVPADGAAS